ncbi:MAG TPA: methyltransferase domain-containing protein [Caulobacteraceae bacterium]|jgi:SAM-dependent methyltransferase|nr:methyltransferase domain-containing protein [Caulobacteraceae bacterium]
MNPFRYHAIVEADHDIQNPLSPEKLQRLIGCLRPTAGERVLDVGCGKGYLLAAIAAQADVDAVGLDLIPAFAEAAQRRLAQTRLLGRAEVIIGPALDYPLGLGDFQVALCIGATFALGGLDGTLERLAASVGPAGRIAVGEPFLRPGAPAAVRERWPEYDRGLAEIVAAIAAHGLTLTGLIASSQDDWDHYESQHWRAAAAWLRAYPDDPDAAGLAERIADTRRQYLAEEREAFGWAVFVAEKP